MLLVSKLQNRIIYCIVFLAIIIVIVSFFSFVSVPSRNRNLASQHLGLESI